MKLVSIRLHPFGGIVDRIFTMRDGTQSLVGPNEFGKSTLRAALRHALFTATDLTPGKLSDLIGPYLSIPDGNSVAVTLRFSHGSTTYRLEKRWGSRAVAMARLVNEGTQQETLGSDQVHERLAAMRVHGEATYDRIFITSQATITGTVNALRDPAHSTLVRSVADAAAGIRRIGGDVDPEILRERLQADIDAASQRWNSSRGEPEYSKTGQGSLEQPWSRGVGEVLGTWYEWKRAEAAVKSRVQLERELDSLNEILRVADGNIAQLTPEIEAMDRLSTGIHERKEAEFESIQRKRDLGQAREVQTAWGAAIARLQANEPHLARGTKDLARLRTEHAAAEEYSRASDQRRQLEDIQEARKQLSEAEERKSKCPEVTPADLEQLTEIQGRIRDAEIKIEAQKLRARLKADDACRVLMSRGTESPEEIVLPKGSEREFGVSGRVSVSIGSVTLAVESAMEDLDHLLGIQSEAREDLAKELRRLGHRDAAAAGAAAGVWSAADAEVRNRRKGLAESLKGKSEAEWEAIGQRLESLPQCRPLPTVLEEKLRAEQELDRIEKALEADRQSVAEWTEKYGALERLGDACLELGIKELSARQKLERLPPYPDGFVDIPTFDRVLRDRREQLTLAERDAASSREAIAGLPSSDDGDLDYLRFEAERKRVIHERLLQSLESKRRVVQAIDEMRDGGDPFEIIHERVARLFERLTGRKYPSIASDSGLPTAVVREDDTALPIDRLSQGTAASLALAVRVALAEYCLGVAPAFVLLDDPFVDLDADRRTHAAAVLRELGSRTQVIMLTCHEHHAEELGPGRVQV